ncbi:hypothetical protein NBRC110019_25930 [Neptunitalea chrysea]|uniref:TerB family tellurite resistance protein n=1 Tax=Neptunitalea chrysea TaxID=1647581 RepID=A0A9W6B7Z3_9FLAO|nr:TerB family tellurite resistance protein [Neptunitalea chrysea]GLB53552.1 hypothetical protein NBRC110019_25930 [Neptunitalea chrysea]
MNSKSKEVKLSILSDMISMATVDDYLKEREYNFLLAVAKQLEVPKIDLDRLFRNPAPFKPQKSETERIIQFYRLVLMMNIDEEQHPKEIKLVKECGLRMGLNPIAMDKVLAVMDTYEDKIVPVSVLLGFFKTHYN